MQWKGRDLSTAWTLNKTMGGKLNLLSLIIMLVSGLTWTEISLKLIISLMCGIWPKVLQENWQKNQRRKTMATLDQINFESSLVVCRSKWWEQAAAKREEDIHGASYRWHPFLGLHRNLSWMSSSTHPSRWSKKKEVVATRLHSSQCTKGGYFW